MSTPNTCEKLQQAFTSLFSCSTVGEYDRIRTPCLYPDGDNIDLFCKNNNGVISISDLGETTRWLRMQTVSTKRSPRQRILIEDIALTHSVEFYKGELIARCKPDDNFAAVAMRVAQAALRVSDLWFTFRSRSVQTASDEVADLLSERHLSFERDERLVGRSGRIWTVDFHIRTSRRSSLVNVLATGSRSASRTIAEHVVAQWLDLSHLTAGPEALQFLSLFDDTADVWTHEDFKLVETLSKVARWSDPDGFLRELEQAA